MADRNPMNQNAKKAFNDFKSEMAGELGVTDYIKDNKNTGEYIPRKVIERAERNLKNK